MVIGLSPQDGESPVELFCKNRSHHLVGKRHSGKGNLSFRPGIDRLGESIGPADDEDEGLAAPGEPVPEPLRPVDRTEFLAMLVEQIDAG